MALRVQKWVHWLEAGRGAAWVTRAAVAACVLTVIVFLGWKGHRGPGSEYVIEEALVARQLAQGEGFTTPVRWPQTVALMRSLDAEWSLEPDAALPELHHPPLYPLVLAGPLAVMGGEGRAQVFADPIPQAKGEVPAYGGDTYLLVVNLMLFAIACALTWLLARRLFPVPVALTALAAVLLSASLWENVLLLGRTPLMMVLVLCLLLTTERLVHQPDDKSRAKICALLAGVLCSLLFLADYTAGLALLPLLGWAFWAFRGKGRRVLLLLMAVGFLLPASPWIVRNIDVSGHPLGLAGQAAAWRLDDPSADPYMARASLAVEPVDFSARKFIRKGVEGFYETLGSGLWVGGGGLFAALFIVSALYRFRRKDTEAVRWLAVVVVLTLLLLPPFFGSGMDESRAVHFLVPVFAIFGAGFLFVLLDSAVEQRWKRYAALALVAVVHAGPLAEQVLEPAPPPYRYPPYLPSVYARTRTMLMDRQPDFRGIMADIPAGLAWYSSQSVWMQPRTYAEFNDVLLIQDIGAQVFSPQLLGRSYFGELAPEGESPFRESWARVYAGLATGELPAFYPLDSRFTLTSDLIFTYK